MIEEGKGKHYLVRFDGVPKPVIVPEPTDAQVALYASARENGLWLTVIELAFGKHINRKQAAGDRQISWVDILSGGYPSDAVAVLTGHGYRPVAAYMPRFEAELTVAVQNRLLIYTSGRVKSKTPGIVHGGHLYAVIDYDARKKVVTVFDPLAENFTPKKGKESLKTGYEQKDGVMHLPFDEFRRVFDGIGCEDPTKAIDRKKKKE